MPAGQAGPPQNTRLLAGGVGMTRGWPSLSHLTWLWDIYA